MTMEMHVNEFVLLNAQKRKSNVAENQLPLDVYKTTSVLPRAPLLTRPQLDLLATTTTCLGADYSTEG